MFKIVMITSMALVALGWIGYGMWRLRENHIEKNRPEEKAGETTEHLTKVKDSFEDYTKRLANFERKNYKREELE